MKLLQGYSKSESRRKVGYTSKAGKILDWSLKSISQVVTIPEKTDH